MTGTTVRPAVPAGMFTRQEALVALNDVADEAKEIYNPEGWETSGTIIADSIGDLIVNLAAGWLTDPDVKPTR